MPRARVIIRDHDGKSQRLRFWNVLGELGIFVTRLIETKDALIVIAGVTDLDMLFVPGHLETLKSKGFEPVPPPELNALKTVVVRDVDPFVTGLSEDILRNCLEQQHKGISKVIKIPNNPRMLKLTFQTSYGAEQCIKNGILLGQQRIDPKSCEMERYFNIRQCMKCYSFAHVTKSCSHSDEFLVCSECAEFGHRFKDCRADFKKCILCEGDHRAVAMRCPVRKEKIKELEKKKKEKEQDARDKDSVEKVMFKLHDVFQKLPNNFATVITTALILAKMEDVEKPGSFQSVFDQVMVENSLPRVKIPRSLFQTESSTEPPASDRDRDRRKRDRSGDFETDLEGAVGYSFPPASQTVTPAISMLSMSSQPDIRAKPPEQPPEQKKEKSGKVERNPQILVFAPTTHNLTNITESTLYKELSMGKRIKYIYQDNSFNKDFVKQIVFDKVIRFTGKDIKYVEVDKFNKLPHGSYLKVDPYKKKKK